MNPSNDDASSINDASSVVSRTVAPSPVPADTFPGEYYGDPRYAAPRDLNLSYQENRYPYPDDRANYSMFEYDRGYQRRSMTPVNGPYTSHFEGYAPLSQSNSFSSRFAMNDSGPSSLNYDAYGQDVNRRHDMSRSMYNIAAVGPSQPIMSSQPFNNSTPYATTTLPYNNRPFAQPRSTELEIWFGQYTRWWNYMNNQRLAAERQKEGGDRHRLTPHRFPHRHSRVCFGSTNQILLIDGTTVKIYQSDPSLIDLGENALITTWPGPLTKNETDKADVLEYIRTQDANLRTKEQMPEDYSVSHQKKQIWLLLSMLVKQNGTISGADLSELLLSNNEAEFESTNESSELGKLRRYLMLGQKKTALEHSTRSSLWGHSFTLTHFMSYNKESAALAASGQMSAMITKFINNTLSRDDPIFVLYRCLLQKQDSKANSKSIPTTNLQQFAMLLANDCDVSPIISESSQSKELLKFIVALRINLSQALVNLGNLEIDYDADEKAIPKFVYSDELVFVNEIWEYARNINAEFIEALVPLKLIFASRLFDYGLISQASQYCYVLRQYYTYYSYYFQGKTVDDSVLNWDTIMQTVNDIECRIYHFDVTGSSKKETEEKPTNAISESPVSNANQDDDDAHDKNDEDDEYSTQGEVDNSELESESAPLTNDKDFTKVNDSRNAIPVSKQNQLIQQSSEQWPSHPNQHSETRSLQNASRVVAPALPTSTSANVTNTNDNRPRLTSVSKVSSSNATPPLTPFESVNDGNIRKTFPQTAVNNKKAPPLAVSNDGPQFFIPAPIPTANQPPIDFISTTSFTPPDVVEQEDAHHNSFPSDGRLSAPPPRDDNQFVANSTVMQQKDHSIGNGNVYMPFSPITSPEVDTSRTRQDSNSIAEKPNHKSQSTSDQSKGKDTKQDGWLTTLVKKVVPTGPKQAILPDDTNPSIYYDKNLMRWVNKDDPSETESLDAIQKGPPKMPLASVPSANISQPPPNQPKSNESAVAPMFSLPGNLPANNLPNGKNSFNYVQGGRKRPQYVDVWQQQQKS